MIGLDTNRSTRDSACLHFPAPQSVAFSVGGISFGLSSDEGLLLALDRELECFAIRPQVCAVNIQVSLANSPQIVQKRLLFDSGGVWSLSEDSDGYSFEFTMGDPAGGPYKTAWFDREFKNGHVILSRSFFDEGIAVYPLEYPLDELLMIYRLGRGEGVEVHAVGIVDETGRGRLFLGHSGAGKSTTARLWAPQSGVHVLSDDRIILRVRDGKIWMHGTPWHGDAGISSPDCSPLHEIYFLEHGTRNQMKPLRGGLAAAELFARSFVPRHCSQALQFSLDFLDRVARDVPCHVFRFLPDQNAVEAIRRARD